jgi:hypothetical protein
VTPPEALGPCAAEVRGFCLSTTTKIRPLREIITKNGQPDELVLNFHSGQSEAWESKKRFVMVLCGTQWGKTSFGPHWLHREIELRGPGDYLAVTATFPLLKLKMLPEFIYVFSTLLKLGTWKVADKVFESFEQDHGGPAWRVIFGSATNPESIESATAKAAWCDELGQHQFQRRAWEAILRRVSIAEGRILGTTTLYEFGWFKTEVYDRYMSGDKDIDVIQGPSTVNPAFPKAEYDRAKATMPRWKFNLFYEGIYSRPAGIIYDAFDEQTCKVKRFKIPSEWLRYVGHDFGPNNTAAYWVAQDPGTGFLYVYRTYLAGGLSAYDHAQRFIQLSRGESVMRRVGGAHAEQGWRDAFTSAGWPIMEPRLREVEAGINRVYGWHQQNKLFVFDDLEDYLDEKMSYSRKLDDDYQPTLDIDNKSKFHLMDAERYLLSDFAPETLENNQVTPVHRNWLADKLQPRSKRLRERMRR